jgi:hypothetical protein
MSIATLHKELRRILVLYSFLVVGAMALKASAVLLCPLG